MTAGRPADTSMSSSGVPGTQIQDLLLCRVVFHYKSDHDCRFWLHQYSPGDTQIIQPLEHIGLVANCGMTLIYHRAAAAATTAADELSAAPLAAVF